MAPGPSLKVIVLLLVGAVGLGLIIVAVFASTGWPLLIVGFGLLGISLPWLWRLERARDRSLG